MSSYILKICGKNIDYFINKLIYLNIEFKGKQSFYNYCIIEVSEEDYLKILKLKTSYEIIILKRKGLVYFLHILKTKKIFLGCCFLILLFLTFLTHMTFKIEVIHTDAEIRELILDDLNELGIKKYHLKVNYATKEKIKEQILAKENKKIEWLEIEEVGTTYQVKVITRVENEKSEELKPRNVVAKKSGLITDIRATTGEVVAKKNQYVEKGDVLITGIIKNKEEVKALVAATGEVYAEIWYKVTLDLPSRYEEEVKTGNSKRVLEFIFISHNIPLNSLHNYEHSKDTKQVLWYHPLLPLQLSYTKKEEINITNIDYNNSDNLDEIYNLAIEKLKTDLGNDIEVLDQKVLKKSVNSANINIELFFKVKENITDYALIDEEELKNEENQDKSE